MFYKVMPTVPVSDLAARPTELLASLVETPIILTNQGEGAGVLVHPKIWNELIEKLEQYQEIITSFQLDEQHILGAQVAAIDEAAGAWSDERHPEMKTPEDIEKWIKSLRSSWSIHEFSTNGAVSNHNIPTQQQIIPEYAQNNS